MVRRTSPLLKTVLAGAAGLVSVNLVGQAFAPSAGSRRNLLLGGAAAGLASVVNQESAVATGFGFGETGNPNDDYSFSAYSLMGGGLDDPDNIFKKFNPEVVGRRHAELEKTYNIFSKLRPEIENKHYSKVKSKTKLQAQTCRQNLQYIANAKDNAQITEVKDEVVKMLDYITVDNRQKKTRETLEDYDALMPAFKTFLDLTA
eukprot:TRINITY_DN1490_c0_g2_i3.p2 TRINITY_DN1490_c0_g2~~TRINITY_DN1490_c0_g2_i3.p2  ORF type:complete len:203 (-),score=70.59 TRINITY_DN1490_c0_g2_i3:252-860(-)